jgi:hypothetical protein
MAEVTYFVALPFVAADDGIAAGEPTECFNPNAFDQHHRISRMPGEWRGRRVPAAGAALARAVSFLNGS